MKNQSTIPKMVYTSIIGLIFFLLTAYIVLSTEPFVSNIRRNVKLFSTGWVSDQGEHVSLEDARVRIYGGHLIAEKRLPNNLTDDDCICFESRNVGSVTVWVDDREVYRFKPQENFTGLGYGIAFHIAGLNASDSAHTARIEIEGLKTQYSTYGRILNVSLGPAADYIHMNIFDRIFASSVSMIIVFLGIILAVIYAQIPDKDSLPFNSLCLGMAAFIIGFWLLIDTHIMQLLTGYIYIWRDLHRTVIFLAVYPIIGYCNSITRLKRNIYLHISFWISVLSLALEISLRYLAGIDMVETFIYFVVFIVAATLIIIIVMFADNIRYCHSQGIKTGFKDYYVGMLIFIGCIFVDLVIYILRLNRDDSYGAFSRVGLVTFVMISLIQFLRWWTRDRAGIERDRFINRALQYAISSNSSEDSIKSMLDYMGKELKARRICVFEDQGNGKFHGTYEWYKEGLESGDLEMLYIPYEGYIDELHKSYMANDRKMIIKDPEDIKVAHPAFYSLLKSYNVKNLVGGPLESNGRITGLLAFIDTPSDLQEQTSEIVSLISYFLNQLIIKRGEQQRLEFFSYNDSMSNARNRRAFNRFIDEELDMGSSFGYFTCTINGFEATNRDFGYEAGDKLIVDMAQCLTDTFGEDNVYRLGGGAFTAFGFESDESFFDADVKRVRRLSADKGINISAGAVYCTYGTLDIKKVIDHATELMRKDIQS